MKNIIFILILLASYLSRAEEVSDDKKKLSIPTEPQKNISHKEDIKTAKIIEKKTPSIKVNSWSVGGRLWQESTSLTDSSRNKFDLKDDFYGVTFGFQRTVYKKGISFKHEGYGFFGLANVDSDDSNLKYFEKGITVIGVGASETIFWLANKASAEFGLNLDIFYRKAIFPIPAAGTSLSDADRILVIIGPQIEWNLFGKTFLVQKVGYSPQAKDVIWNFGIVHKGALW